MKQKLIDAGVPANIADVLAKAIDKFVAEENVTIDRAIVKFEVHCFTPDHCEFAIGHHENLKCT